MANYGENLCNGGTPTASGVTGKLYASYLTDNNTKTYWSYKTSIFPQWVQYTFSKEERINRVSILSYYDSGYESIKNIRILGSNTGIFSGEEKLLYTGVHPENEKIFYNHDFNNDEKFKYIRIMIDSIYLGNGGSNISIYEMQMFSEIRPTKFLIRNEDNIYYYHNSTQWLSLGISPTSEQILNFGMENITTQQINDFESEYGLSYYPVRWTTGDKASTVQINATPKNQILTAKNSIQLTGVETATFNWTAIGGSRVALSINEGFSYHALKNGIWLDVTNDMSNAMTAEEYSNMTWEQYKLLAGDSNFLKHQYYIPDNSEVDDILITVELMGSNKLSNTSDYTTSYDQSNKKITISINKSGTYFANYVDVSE